MTFLHALSYGLPVGVIVALALTFAADEPDIGLHTRVGLVAALATAVSAMVLRRTKAGRRPLTTWILAAIAVVIALVAVRLVIVHSLPHGDVPQMCEVHSDFWNGNRVLC